MPPTSTNSSTAIPSKRSHRSVSPFTAARRQRKIRWVYGHPQSLVAVPKKSKKRRAYSKITEMVLSLFCFPSFRKAEEIPPPTQSTTTKDNTTPPNPEASHRASNRLSTVPEEPQDPSPPIQHGLSANEETYTSFPAPTFKHAGQPRALDSRTYPELAQNPPHSPKHHPSHPISLPLSNSNRPS